MRPFHRGFIVVEYTHVLSHLTPDLFERILWRSKRLVAAMGETPMGPHRDGRTTPSQVFVVVLLVAALLTIGVAQEVARYVTAAHDRGREATSVPTTQSYSVILWLLHANPNMG